MKYSQEQLQAMAKEALEAKDNDDMRWMFLVLQISTMLNLSPEIVESKIKELV